MDDGETPDENGDTRKRNDGAAHRRRWQGWLFGGAAIAVSAALHGLPAMLPTVRTTIVLVGLVAVIACGYRHWLGKTSSTLSLLLLAAVAAASLALHVPLNAYAAVSRYGSVFELIVGMALIRKVLARVRFDDVLMRIARRIGAGLRAPVLSAMTGILSVPLGVGAVGLLCSTFSDVLQPRVRTAAVTMRTASAMMLILPSTASAALVVASLPGLDRLEAFTLALPLLAVGLVGSCLGRIDLKATVEERSGEPGCLPLKPILVFWALLALFMPLVNWQGSEAVALAGVGLFALDALAFSPRGGAAVLRDVADAIGGVTTEVLLLCACGFLSDFLCKSALLGWTGDLLHFGGMGVAGVAVPFVLFVLPALSMVGVHPVILFSVCFPLLDAQAFGGTAKQYLVWVAMFAVAQLVSPVSTSTMLAGTGLRVGAKDVSFRLNALYAALMCTWIWIYVVFV